MYTHGCRGRIHNPFSKKNILHFFVPNRVQENQAGSFFIVDPPWSSVVDWSTTIDNVDLVDGLDNFRWNLTKIGLFTVRSFYLYLLDTHPPFRHKLIWKLKIPLKIKIFLWFLQRGVVLTKDNLAKKNWTRSQRCCGCNSNETIKHLLLDCPYARMVWRIIFYATGLIPPRSISHMFDSWLSNQSKKN